MLSQCLLDFDSGSLSLSEELQHHLLSLLEAEGFLQLDDYSHELRGIRENILPPALPNDVA